MIAWSLVATSVLCGLAITVAFSRLADLAALRNARKRVQAHFLEIRLYSDEPRFVFRAQASLVRANLKLLAVLARPMLILSLPMAWVLLQFDAVYGARPLPLGEPAIVTAQLNTPLTDSDRNTLQAPAEISVETGAVRSFADRQVSWRVRPVEPVRGLLRLSLRGSAFEKDIAAGSRGLFLISRTSSSLFEWLLHPAAGRLPAGDVAWVEVRYPATGVTIAGIALPWIVWFLIISTAVALLSARWLRIPL